MELLNIWSRTSTTIVFVTHSIPEAVFLSDRIVIMSPRPGRIDQIIDVTLPRPRESEIRQDPEFFRLIAAVRDGLSES
jgi:NitT/TauT family transport system ATP-binding protein